MGKERFTFRQDCSCQPWKAVIREVKMGKVFIWTGLLDGQELSGFLLLFLCSAY